MPRTSSYYPARIGDQIVWLRNARNKIANYKVALGYADDDIAAFQADCDRLIWLLETLQSAAQSFAQSVTSHLHLMQDGPTGPLVVPPAFTLPATPAPPANVAPGALKRITSFVNNLKTRTGYDDPVGQDLAVVGPQVIDNPNAYPDAKVEAHSGEVIGTFKKLGHLGAYWEGQVGNEAEWTFLAIVTTTYHDTRPLRVPNQPEKRRYRLCFWDGQPTRVWTPVMEVVFGG